MNNPGPQESRQQCDIEPMLSARTNLCRGEGGDRDPVAVADTSSRESRLNATFRLRARSLAEFVLIET